MTTTVGVLGATGGVGQQLVRSIAAHDSFELAAVTARSPDEHTGEPYGAVVDWRLPGPLPEEARALVVTEPDLTPDGPDLDVLVSALPTRVAQRVESRAAEAGYPVCSTAMNERLSADVPLLVPEVNADHLGLLERQREQRGWDGAIVKSPAATTTLLSVPLSVLADRGIEGLTVSVLQGVSAAEADDLGSMAGLNNVVPEVPGERSKLSTELRTVLGTFDGRDVDGREFDVSASCNRVPVQDGLLANVWATLADPLPVVDLETALRDAPTLDLPSSPPELLRVFFESDRPQPRLDAEGQQFSVGSVEREDDRVRFDCLTHPTLRGGAGNALLAAELLVEDGYV